MTGVHIALGVGMVVVNLAAGLLGAFRWWRGTPSRLFWPLLRAGQALAILAAADGLILVLQGDKLPELHLVYGLTPIAVSFLAEQLRLASADSVLAARDLDDAQAMRALPEAEQH